MVVDFPLLIPTSRKITILSNTIVIRRNYFDSIFEAFHLYVWILIMLSCLITISINIYNSKSLQLNISFAIEYLSLLVGQSIGIRMGNVFQVQEIFFILFLTGL